MTLTLVREGDHDCYVMAEADGFGGWTVRQAGIVRRVTPRRVLKRGELRVLVLA